jgi:hypothetical protein
VPIPSRDEGALALHPEQQLLVDELRQQPGGRSSG